MHALLTAMRKATDSASQQLQRISSVSLPPTDEALSKAFSASLDCRKAISKSWTTAENQLRASEQSAANSADMTLGRALEVIGLLERGNRTPYAGRKIEDHIRVQAGEILDILPIAAAHFSRRLFRPDFLKTVPLFVMLRISAAATKYRQPDEAAKILMLLQLGYIHTKLAYYLAGQLLGGHVRNADQYAHVSLKDVQAAYRAIELASAWQGEYHDALEAYRYAPVRHRNSPEALNYIIGLAKIQLRDFGEANRKFRTLCEEGPPSLQVLWKTSRI